MDLERNMERIEIANHPVGLRERLKHFTWAWFTATMSTGGLAIAVAKTPHKFNGLHTIGLIIFILNIALFLLLCTCMALRATLHYHHFRKSLTLPPESFFSSSFLLSLCTIIIGTQIYGLTYGPAGPWLVTATRILYWVYAAFALLNAIQQYFIFIIRTPLRSIPFNPSWFLAGYSSMLTGTMAGLIAESQPPAQRMAILISGCAFEGFGWFFTQILVVMYICALMEKGLPPFNVRPGMFIPVGSAAYTIVALIGQARSIPTSYGYFYTHPAAVETLQTVALFISVFLWLYTFWIFAIAVLGCIMAIPKMGFALPWWAFIFPNVGFTIATIDIGEELGSEGILRVGSAMIIGLVGIWLFTSVMCVRAVILGRIMFPGKDEDKDMLKKE